MNAARPADSHRIKAASGCRRFACDNSPVACASLLLADAPGVRHAAEQLRHAATLPPELTAALFGFALGLICGIGLCYPKDRR